MALLALVELNDLFSINRMTFVGIHDHAKKARISLKKVGNECK